MPIDALLVVGLVLAIVLLARWHWESGGDDGEPPTLDTRNHLDED